MIHRGFHRILLVEFTIWILALLLAATAARASDSPTEHRDDLGGPDLPAAGPNDPKLEQRFREEAPAAWADVEQFYRKLSGNFTISHKIYPIDTPKLKSQHLEFVLNDELFKQMDVDKEGTEHVLVRNDEYTFQVGRKSGDAQARFAIESLTKNGADLRTEQYMKLRIGELHSAVFAPWRFYKDQRTLADWIATRSFAITNVSAFGPGNGALVRVDFKDMEVGPDTRPFMLKGAVILDPSDHWIFREWKTLWPKGGSHYSTFEYGQRQEGYPILTKWKRIMTGLPGDNGWHEQTNVYEGMHHGTASPDEFRLSYFGIPEPDFSSSRHRGSVAWWSIWWYANLGLICLLVAFLVWRRRKERNAFIP